MPSGSDESSVTFTLKVSEGATLQDGHNNDLPLNENNQYTTNMDFGGNKKYDFIVIAQDGNTSATYSVGVLQQQADSKEIVSFAFLQSDNSHLKANIAMDINGQNITKTVTNVEGITGLTPYIVHSGSDISPASGVVQNFSTNNTYTVTAIDQTTSDYTVTLTGYYGVSINTNGGLITGAPTTTGYVIYGTQAIFPSDPSQKHYGFKGWYDAPSGGDVFDFNTDITTKTIIYARWTNKQYRVSFNTAGGSAISTVTVDSLTPVAKPDDPTTNHYALEGWYVDNTFTARYNFNWVVSNELALYAKYTNKQYQVRFYQGANLLKTVLVTSLDEIPALNYPVNPNAGQAYEWYKDDGLTQVYDKNFLVTGDLDLYAKEVKASFGTIIDNGIIPAGLANYGRMSELIFSRYTAGAMVVARYVTTNGNGDGSSWANAANDIQGMLNGITDAGVNKVYVILIASGTYKPGSSYAMKNHIALVGGFTAESYDRAGETLLDGDGNKRVFNNDYNGLDKTSLLYGVTITNGYNNDSGSGMRNRNSSPTLINITFSGNTTVNGSGGGMFNNFSSALTLINVTFSGNTANRGGGGGMCNFTTAAILINVTFSDNIANNGGGMYNANSSSTTLINVTFSGNTAHSMGGGMNNGFNSSSTLINVTFSDNRSSGDGIFHDGNGKPLILINTIMWNNNWYNIHLQNDNGDTETVHLYHSLIEGGTNASITATGIRLNSDDTTAHPISINGESFITDDPGLGTLADHGGKVNTSPLEQTSPARNKGVYIRGVKAGNTYPETNLYYSTNNTAWYSDPGLTNPVADLPGNADDLTATDARGYGRVGRPDMGAYEVGGTP